MYRLQTHQRIYFLSSRKSNSHSMAGAIFMLLSSILVYYWINRRNIILPKEKEFTAPPFLTIVVLKSSTVLKVWEILKFGLRQGREYLLCPVFNRLNTGSMHAYVCTYTHIILLSSRHMLNYFDKLFTFNIR